MKRRDFIRLVALGSGGTALDWGLYSNVILAKDIYPARKIEWISHTQPGSGFDIIPRGIGPFLTKHLKELAPGSKGGEIVVKNEPAAAGLKAYSRVLRGEPNGYIIGGLDIAFITDMVTGKVDKNEIDIKKFTYLSKLNSNSKLLITGKNGFQSWADAVESSKKSPLKIGTGQFGRANHVSLILIMEALGLNAKVINTQSTAATMSMLMRGDVHVALTSDESVSNFLESKEVRVLVDCTEKSRFPGALSMTDLGHPEVVKYAQTHRFIIAPPNLPKEINALLTEALKKTMRDKEFLIWAKRAGFDFEPIYGSAAREMAMGYISFYQGMEQTLKKYLL